MLKGLIKFLLILNSNQKPWQIAGAGAMGFLLAMIPAGNLLWIGLFILFLLMRVNRAVGLMFMILFRLLAPFYDGVLDFVGYGLLTEVRLEPLWMSLYNLPVVPFTSFNDSLVMGGFVVGVLLFIPVMFVFRILVDFYRKKMIPLWCNSKIYKKLNTLPWFKKLLSAFKAGSKVVKVGRS